MAYQICFDLYESASQQFLSSVIQNLRTVGTPIPAVPGSTNTGTVPMPDKDRWAGEKNKGILLTRLKHCVLFTASGTYLSFREGVTKRTTKNLNLLMHSRKRIVYKYTSSDNSASEYLGLSLMSFVLWSASVLCPCFYLQKITTK